ncbi:MAG TPA: hypothetical protein PK583_03155, partial [Gammaproteobacteria bacterium]|nr:hypothetical protein [Gammaproteobacteria bacterium]
NDYTSCGAYTIENLLISALGILWPDPESIRRLHLEALKQYNPNFYGAFDERQRKNRPTTATLHEQLGFLNRLKDTYFSKHELNRILALKKCLAGLSDGIKEDLLGAFKQPADNNDHAFHLTLIRIAVQKAMQFAPQPLVELIRLLFGINWQPGTTLSLNEINFRVSYEEILAVTKRKLESNQINGLQKDLIEQIKQDEQFALKLQTEFYAEIHETGGEESLKVQLFDVKVQIELLQPAVQEPSSSSPGSVIFSQPESPRSGRIHSAAVTVPNVSLNDITKFLTFVAEGEQDKAEAMLKSNPILALSPGDVTDLSKRTFNGITGFQYAVWALDWHMWTMIRKYLPDEEARLQTQGFEMGSWVKEHGINASWKNLEDAQQKFIDEANGGKIAASNETWIRQVGGAQLLLPAHVVNEYCRSDRTFWQQIPNFSKGEVDGSWRSSKIRVWGGSDEAGEWFTKQFDEKVLGNNFGICKGGYPVPLGIITWQHHGKIQIQIKMDQEAVHSLFTTRLQQRDTLFSELSVSGCIKLNKNVRPKK